MLLRRPTQLRKDGEAEIYRIAGEIALKSPERDEAKAEDYFERALTAARHQQARSWELRAAMSLARLRGDQGGPGEGYDLLVPVYEWFTEGFDTRDLREANYHEHLATCTRVRNATAARQAI
jgi:predicted ATPase